METLLKNIEFLILWIYFYGHVFSQLCECRPVKSVWSFFKCNMDLSFSFVQYFTGILGLMNTRMVGAFAQPVAFGGLDFVKVSSSS